jgi:SAM-dependent methyltransferase
MNRAERQAAHAVQGRWLPNPEAHFQSPRDAYHVDWTRSKLQGQSRCSILDVGAYDGWLDFLLMRDGHKVEGVELIPELCESARGYAFKNAFTYTIHQGFFDEIAIDKRFDVVLSYETLEHIPLEMVPVYISKMEAIATRSIFISLPDQRHEDNAQHLWTPSMSLILSMWGLKKNFEVTYKPYPGTDIPANFLIRWDI